MLCEGRPAVLALNAQMNWRKDAPGNGESDKQTFPADTSRTALGAKRRASRTRAACPRSACSRRLRRRAAFATPAPTKLARMKTAEDGTHGVTRFSG